MLRNFASVFGQRSLSNRKLKVEPLEVRAMLSVSGVIDPSVAAGAVDVSEGQAAAAPAAESAMVDAEALDALPPGDSGGTTNQAPTTTGIADVSVNRNAADQVIRLCDVFTDLEDTSSALHYEVVRNSNPSLFDLTDTNNAEGTLTLAFAKDVSGTAALTVRATDTSGLSVETTFTVNVAGDNLSADLLAPVTVAAESLASVSAIGPSGLGDGGVVINGTGWEDDIAPTVTSFVCTAVKGGPQWWIRGAVSDPDDDITSCTLSFGGELTGCAAAIGADGTFSFFPNLGWNVEGLAWVTVTDPHLKSDTRYTWMAYS